MTRPARAPAPAPAPAQNDTAEEIPLHPLFATSRDPKPLAAAIETIDVNRRTAEGTFRMVRWVPADDLPDEMALEEIFGPGDYHLVGRDAARARILRRNNISVGDSRPAEAAPAPAPAGGGSNALLEYMKFSREERELERRRDAEERKAEREREDRRSGDMLKMVTTFAGAQIETTREMARTLLATKQQPQGNAVGSLREAMDVLGDLQATEKAKEDLLREQLEGERGKNQTDVLETFVEAMATGLTNKMNVNGGMPSGGNA